MFEYNLVITFYILHAQDKCSLYNDELYSIMKNIYLFSLKCTNRWCKIKYLKKKFMCPKNKSINRLKHLKYRNIYIKIDRNRMLDIVIHYSYVWNLSHYKSYFCRHLWLPQCFLQCITGTENSR